MSEPRSWQLLERKLLASGRVSVTVSIAPGKQVRFVMDPKKATDDHVQAMVDAAIATGRYDELPPRSFE